jgi:hypothetical protein
MSDGNRNPEGQELGSTVRQGAGALPPMLCRSEGRKRNGSNRRTQLTEVNSEKEDGRTLQDYSTATSDTAEPETTNKLMSGQFEAF